MLLKWKYYILLFAILVFLAETISISFWANGSTTPATCKTHMALKMEAKKDCCKKQGNKETKKPMNCIDCPLCCITLTTPFFVKSFALPEVTKNRYCVFKNPLLSSYHVKLWKPPNAFSLSIC